MKLLLRMNGFSTLLMRRGKEFYEKYGDKFISILQEPDFIFKDKENTALVCKEFEINNKYVNLVTKISSVN